MSASGGGVTRLTNDTLIDLAPVYSPDGMRVIFQRYLNAADTYELFTMGVGGGAEDRLTIGTLFDTDPDWQSVPASVDDPVTTEPELPADPTAPCTIVGTAGADVLFGTPGNDIICGFGGNDVIFGDGGNDVLRGGRGADRLYGAAGNDILRGVGADRIDGGLDVDVCGGEIRLACEL
jgi:Ca2+-binding RTX toxin-like protein